MITPVDGFSSFGVDGLSSHAVVHWFSIYTDGSGVITLASLLATQIMKYISTGNPSQFPYICNVWSCFIPPNEKLSGPCNFEANFEANFWLVILVMLVPLSVQSLWPRAFSNGLTSLFKGRKICKFPIKKHKSIICFRKDPKKPSSIHFLYSFLRESCLICQAKALIFQKKTTLFLNQSGWVVSTPLKNIRHNKKQNWKSSPGVKIKDIIINSWNHYPVFHLSNDFGNFKGLFSVHPFWDP